MGGLQAPECLQEILDLLDDGVACMDLEGRVQVWNRASDLHSTQLDQVKRREYT